MREWIRFVRTSVAGGFFVLLPLVIVVLLFGELFDMIDGLLIPMAEHLPVHEVGGVEVAFLLGVLLIVLLCFVSGLLLSTRLGSRINEAVERAILDRVPGYRFVRTLTDRFNSAEAQAAVLVREGVGNAWRLGVLVEEAGDSHAVVFLPLAPTPTIGSIVVVDRSDVRRLDASAGAAMNTVLQWGVGTGALAAEHMGDERA